MLGKPPQPRRARELAQERVEMLGVVVLFADPGGTADGSQAVEGIG